MRADTIRPKVHRPSGPNDVARVLRVLDDAARARLEAAYRESGSDLWRAVFAYSGGVTEVADEAVAEAFAQAGRRLGTVRDLNRWTYTAAFRIATELLRQRRLDIPLDHLEEEALKSMANFEDSEIAVSELLLLVRVLTPRQRLAFVMRDALGFSSAETAALCGLSDVAVRVHLHAARRRLRQAIREVQ